MGTGTEPCNYSPSFFQGWLPKACHTAPRPCAEYEGSPKPQKLSVKRSSAVLLKSPPKGWQHVLAPSRLLATSGPLLSSFQAGISRPMCVSVLVPAGNSHPLCAVFLGCWFSLSFTSPLACFSWLSYTVGRAQWKGLTESWDPAVNDMPGAHGMKWVHASLWECHIITKTWAWWGEMGAPLEQDEGESCVLSAGFLGFPHSQPCVYTQRRTSDHGYDVFWPEPVRIKSTPCCYLCWKGGGGGRNKPQISYIFFSTVTEKAREGGKT